MALFRLINRSSNVSFCGVIVDMSLLWLWWVAHQQTGGWDAGRPYLIKQKDPWHSQILRQRNIHDQAYIDTKALNLTSVDVTLEICNGLDVKNRTVFDHNVITFYILIHYISVLMKTIDLESMDCW